MRFCLLVAIILAVSLPAAGSTVTFSFDTSTLVGNTAGPFSIAFQFADGSGTDDGNNAVVVSDISFGTGGSASGSALLFGSASGDLTTSVVLTDADSINYFMQEFVAGDILTFTVTLTDNLDAGDVQDEFTFAILDNTYTSLPTTAGEFFDVFVDIRLSASGAVATVYSSDMTRTVAAGGGTIDITEAQAAAPEPATLALVGVGLVMAGLVARRRRL